MLAHGRAQLLALADLCATEDLGAVNGWRVDLWRMDEESVDAAVELYAAVLAGGATDPVIELLAQSGLDLPALLRGDGKDDITRSDLTELAAAASLVAQDGCNVDDLVMPNVPKMSRRKSDSGIDIFATTVSKSALAADELSGEETLTIGSVKHSIAADSTAGIRGKLDKSLSTKHELTGPYVTQQLRVLNGQLVEAGYSAEAAARVYFFLEDFPARDYVKLIAVGFVAPDMEDDFKHHIELLTTAGDRDRSFRAALMPGLRTVHARCP